MKTVTVCKCIDWRWFSLLLPVSHNRFGVSTVQTVTPNNATFSLCLSVAPTKCVSERMSETATETACQIVESLGLCVWGRHEIRKQTSVSDISWQFTNPGLPMKRLTKSKWGILIFFWNYNCHHSDLPYSSLWRCTPKAKCASLLLSLDPARFKACRQNYWINMITNIILLLEPCVSLIYTWIPTNATIIIQFISYVWWLLHVSALYCHPQEAFLKPSERCAQLRFPLGSLTY
jgi:hypothetical protein